MAVTLYVLRFLTMNAGAGLMMLCSCPAPDWSSVSMSECSHRSGISAEISPQSEKHCLVLRHTLRHTLRPGPGSLSQIYHRNNRWELLCQHIIRKEIGSFYFHYYLEKKATNTLNVLVIYSFY